MANMRDSYVNCTITTDSTWRDLDLSSYFVEDNVVAVMIVYDNTNSTAWGFRKNGSTDADLYGTDGGRTVPMIVPVDSNGILEYNVAAGEIHFWGELTAAEYYGFTNKTSYGVASAGTWESEDLSSDIQGTDVPALAIFEILDGSSRDRGGRPEGSTQTGTFDSLRHAWIITPINTSNDQVELYKGGSSGTDFALSGYFKEASHATYQADQNSVTTTLTATSTWENHFSGFTEDNVIIGCLFTQNSDRTNSTRQASGFCDINPNAYDGHKSWCFWFSKASADGDIELYGQDTGWTWAQYAEIGLAPANLPTGGIIGMPV
jgi:hypothetical protein